MDKIIPPDVEGTIENKAREAIKIEDPSLEKINFAELEYDYLGEVNRDPGEESWVGYAIFTGETTLGIRGPNARVSPVDIYVEFTYMERGDLTMGKVHIEETDF